MIEMADRMACPPLWRISKLNYKYTYIGSAAMTRPDTAFNFEEVMK